MAAKVTAGPLITVTPEPLSPDAFATLGVVLESQTTSGGIVHDARRQSSSSNTDTGTTTTSNPISGKEDNHSKLENLYAAAPSRIPAQPHVSTVSCAPSSADCTTAVQVLKRHLYTSLSVVPLNTSGRDPNVANLIVVAPSLPVSAGSDINDEAKVPAATERGGERGGEVEERQRKVRSGTSDRKKKRSRFDVFARARPSPFTNDHDPPLSSVTSMSSSVKEAVAAKLSISPSSSSEEKLVRQNSGQPDLSHIRAFRIRDGQMLVLSPGTWYALLVANVAGEANEGRLASPSFVLVRYCNGVEGEDENAFRVANEEGVGPVVQIVLKERTETSLRSKL